MRENPRSNLRCRVTAASSDRSEDVFQDSQRAVHGNLVVRQRDEVVRGPLEQQPARRAPPRHVARERLADEVRSEEHTSELQSHSDLVCRLLLEKKNKLTGEELQ